MGELRTTFRAAARDKFGFVLLACMATYILLISFDSTQWSGLIGALPVLVTVIFTINAAAPSREMRLAALGLILAAIVVGIVSAAHQDATAYGIAMLLTGFSLSVCIVAVLKRMAEHTRVNVHTVLAVLAGYVMLGLFFTFIDSGIGHIMGKFFAQSGAHSQSDYAYLSYITLTTVGFGDLTPGTGIARSVIILEALVGQIFLVTLVARMVSMLGTERRPISLDQGEDPPEPRE